MGQWLALLLFLVGWAFAWPAPLWAQTDAAREFKQLQEQHEKAVAAALEPLQRRQAAALDQLLRRATQANDLDTAVKIRAELQKLGIVAPGSPATPGAPGSDEARRAALRAQLRDSRWALGDGKTITLRADGSTSASWHGKHGTWKVIAPEQAELSFSNSLSLRVATFDAGLTKATIAEGKGPVLETLKRVQP